MSAISLIGKPSNQSSFIDSATADKALDGNIDGVYNHGSCMHTSKWKLIEQKNPLSTYVREEAKNSY